jgi:hypothetical protein
MESLGKKACRVRNTLAKSEIGNFKKRRPRDGKAFVVGYYSGSKTHQADFRQAGRALVRFMKEFPSVEFRLVGEFDLGDFPDLQKWTGGDGAAPRVTRVELLPHSEMLEDQLECDVIIAPLEVGNPFCEAKSELKFFEASLAARAVIASPTLTFCEATQNGRYAQLASTSEEWLQAFHRVFRDVDRISETVGHAHQYVMDEYSPAAAGLDAARAYSDILGAVDYPAIPQSSAVANSNSIR